MANTYRVSYHQLLFFDSGSSSCNGGQINDNVTLLYSHAFVFVDQYSKLGRCVKTTEMRKEKRFNKMISSTICLCYILRRRKKIIFNCSHLNVNVNATQHSIQNSNKFTHDLSSSTLHHTHTHTHININTYKSFESFTSMRLILYRLISFFLTLSPISNSRLEITEKLKFFLC